MAKLKKSVDKGIAYLKKNGVRAAAARTVRRLYLSREVDYEKWLRAQRKRWAAEAAGWESGGSAELADRIRVVVAGRLPEKIAEEDFFLFIEKGDRLEGDARRVYARAVSEHPGAELFYCDSDEIGTDGRHHENPWCKPDFDEYYLQSVDYIGGGFLVSGRIVKALGVPRTLYDYLWRCIELAGEAVHVPEILHHRAAHFGAAQEEALRAHFARIGVNAEVSAGAWPGMRRITYCYEEEAPLVSILIPNKDHREDLEKCIGSIRRLAGYEPYEIIVIENNSTSQKTFSFYEELKERDAHVRVITCEGDFNFSKINNFGASQARGSYLLFLNNDTEMIADGTVRELMNYARRPDVGAVGAQLFYEDDTIQHVGVIVGYGGAAGHAFEGVRRPQMSGSGRPNGGQTAASHIGGGQPNGGQTAASHIGGGQPNGGQTAASHIGGRQPCGESVGAPDGVQTGALHVGSRKPRSAPETMLPWPKRAAIVGAHQCSAVTAACMAMRRSVFEELGGFDEALGVAYNDIDFCLRIGEAGKKVVYTPYAQLYHYESRTRGLELTQEKAERVRRETELFRKRWGAFLKKGDPYYNRNLTLEKSDFSLRR